LFDVIPTNSWTELLEPLNSSPLYVYYYGTVNTNLQIEGSTSKLASLGVYIWYNQNYTPLWGELSYSFSMNYGQNITKAELLQSKQYYDQLGTLSNYFSANSSLDITDILYRKNPTFCL